ncbi:tetratricopeptide repeat protein [Streptomyces sp. NPDC056796]|uniref:P-loop NTPase n=1 Tax=Streptomyces sp. NPDC056796 TaxID=3345947 RepID=UPI00369FDDCC
MERSRLIAVTGSGGPGSGYAVGARLVLTSAHVVAGAGLPVELFRPAGDVSVPGVVVWCGTAGSRDDAALVRVADDVLWRPPYGTARVRWGRTATDRPDTVCETWGVPEVVQREGRPIEAAQLTGRVNPGTGFVGNQYVMELAGQVPRWPSPGSSPWGGLSGAAVFCDRLLIGVVAADREYSAHAALNVVPSYVLHHDPAFRAALAEYGGGGAVALEAAEFQHLADEDSTGPGDGPRTPAALLRAERRTVPFYGREELLGRLVGWCERSGFGAWLLHGPGGQGKSRLAHQLSDRMAASGWVVLWLRSDGVEGRVRELRDAAKPLLVVVDYAENRVAQLVELIDAAAAHPGSTAFKVLLLARTAGAWWARAQGATRRSEEWLHGTPVVELPPLQPEPSDRRNAYRRAVGALADALPQVRGVAATDWPALAEVLTQGRLPESVGGAGMENALTLQMTALADLLDAAGTVSDGAADGPPDRPPDEVEDRLLGHERRYWDRRAAVLGLTPALSSEALETALVAAQLMGAASPGQADLIWGRLPELADQGRDRRTTITAWIGSLYPSGAVGVPWSRIQPDRLGERFTGRLLEADPGVADRLAAGADAEQTTQLLAVYSRAAAHGVFQGRLDRPLVDLCLTHRGRLAGPLMTTVTRTTRPEPLIAALREISDDPGTALADLQAFADQLPESSRRLASWALDLSRVLADRYRDAARVDPGARPGLARAVSSLAGRLGAMGRREEGLAFAVEAVDLNRSLDAAEPGVHGRSLAAALNILANRQAELGRWADSSVTAQEAVLRYRALPERGDGYHRDLAMALSNLSVSLGRAGRPEEGLTAAEESVRIRRHLVRDDAAHQSDLAISLNNYANRLSSLGRWEESLAISQETVGLYRVLARENPDAYLPLLARALSNYSVDLGEARREEEGLSAVEEAVRLRRDLVRENPAAHVAGLAASLLNLAQDLGRAGRRAEGLAAAEEAAGYYDELARKDAGAFEELLGEARGTANALRAAPGGATEDARGGVRSGP